MYLIECVGATAVEIPGSSSRSSSSSLLQQSSRISTKIPVPSRHQPGGGGAAAAAAAAIAASACTPEEIYCYTQFEPNYSARFTRFPTSIHANMGPVHHLEVSSFGLFFFLPFFLYVGCQVQENGAWWRHQYNSSRRP